MVVIPSVGRNSIPSSRLTITHGAHLREILGKPKFRTYAAVHSSALLFRLATNYLPDIAFHARDHCDSNHAGIDS